MKQVNQEMLEKYAVGQLPEQDRHLVESWLEDDSWDSLGASEDTKDDIGQAIWDEVSPVSKSSKKIRRIYYFAAAAATLVFGAFLFQHQKTELDVHSFTNESSHETKFISEELYDVYLGGNSNARIDLINNKLNYSGDFLFKPKRDFNLVDADQNVLNFKAGREYFISNSPDFGKPVLFERSDLAFLPAGMLSRIREQFQSI